MSDQNSRQDRQASVAAEPLRLKFRIVGDVQNVGMRAWIRSEALHRGIGGWARNEPDQSVTALFVGPAAVLQNTADWLRQGNPHAAVVDIIELALDDFDLSWDPAAGFSILEID